MDVGEIDRSLERGLKTLWISVWRHKILFSTISLFVFALIVAGLLVIQPVYEASTLVLGGQANLERSPDGSRVNAENSISLSRIAESEEVIEKAIEIVGLKSLDPTPAPAAPTFQR